MNWVAGACRRLAAAAPVRGHGAAAVVTSAAAMRSALTSVHHPACQRFGSSAQLMASRACAHTFAVVHVGGKQYKVTENDVIVTNKLNCEVGSHIRLEKVLLMGTSDKTLVGQPILSRDEAVVTAMVTEQSKGAKVIAFKKKRRQGYARRKDFEPDLTFLRIQKVEMLTDTEQASRPTPSSWPSQASSAASSTATA